MPDDADLQKLIQIAQDKVDAAVRKSKAFISIEDETRIRGRIAELDAQLAADAERLLRSISAACQESAEKEVDALRADLRTLAKALSVADDVISEGCDLDDADQHRGWARRAAQGLNEVVHPALALDAVKEAMNDGS